MAYEHEHKYFIFHVKSEFDQQGETYTKTEYAVLGCPCGNVIKKKVINEL